MVDNEKEPPISCDRREHPGRVSNWGHFPRKTQDAAGKPRIARVLSNSPARDAGLEAGDVLLAVNGEQLRDLIDYKFATAREHLVLSVARDGMRVEFLVDKDPDEDLGLAFESDTFDGMMTCRNRCRFCFVHQLPPGLRPELYVKDDDYRLSVLHGNFITLTNLDEDDLDRICRLHLGPLYISVHTTNPSLREALLGCRAAGRLPAQLRRIAGAGVIMHTQIVLCPGINDGPELERTVGDLASLGEAVWSIGIVPVGLTSHRQGLPALEPVGAGRAAEIIDRVFAWQKGFRRERGIGLVYAADEFFVRCGAGLPGAAYYDGYPQLENGIGLIRLFLDEVNRAARRLPKALPEPRRIGLVCGEAASGVLRDVAARLAGVANLEVAVIPVANRFFGPSVTVSGLLTAHDILAAVRRRPEGEIILLPEAMFRPGDGRTLDDDSLSGISAAAGRPLLTVPARGREFLAAVLGGRV